MTDRGTSPAEPLGYFVPPGGPRRPTAVTVISVLAILFGAYGAMGLRFVVDVVANAPNWRTTMNYMGHWGTAILFLNLIVAGIFGAILLVAGVLALVLRPSGRRLLLAYAMLHPLVWLVCQVLVLWVILPGFGQPAPTPLIPPGNTAKVVIHSDINFHAVVRYGMLSIIPYFILTSLWSAVVIYVFTRPGVKAAFKRTVNDDGYATQG